MYAVSEERVKVNGEVVDTFRRRVRRGNALLDVETGTTGYKEKSRTFLQIQGVNGDYLFDTLEERKGGSAVGVVVACNGTKELDALITALEFARKVIDDQRRGIKD